jgi:hypothetical protein
VAATGLSGGGTELSDDCAQVVVVAQWLLL